LKILGIDTSSKYLSIALSEDDSIIVEHSFLLDRKHSSLLIPKINQMLKEKNVPIGNIDAFVVGLGPGSFTGLRIGVSTVKGFGLASGKPCIGVSSIDALALNVDTEHSTIVPVIDAKRENLYSAIYEIKNNRINRKTNHLLLKIDEILKKVKKEAVFLGDGIDLYREKITQLNKKAVFLEDSYWYPKAGNLIKLGITKIKKYKKRDLARLNPIYLYPKDCQVRHFGKSQNGETQTSPRVVAGQVRKP